MKKLHKWNISVKEALEIQKKYSQFVIQEKLKTQVKIVAGCDVAFAKNSNIACAGVILLSYPELSLVYSKVLFSKIKFPYIPGFLSFREAPALINVFKEIKIKIDLVFVDGNGLAHPRKFGIASHLGLILNLPTIGCAKTYFLGNFIEPDLKAGNFSKLYYEKEVIGAVVRTREKVKPIFVSVGHKTNLDDAVSYTLKCCKGYRIPEPIRQAHILVNQTLKDELKK